MSPFPSRRRVTLTQSAAESLALFVTNRLPNRVQICISGDVNAVISAVPDGECSASRDPTFVNGLVTANCHMWTEAEGLPVGLDEMSRLAVRRQVHLHLLTILLLPFGQIGCAACWLARHLRNLRSRALMRIVDSIQFATYLKTYFRVLHTYCILKIACRSAGLKR